MLLKITNKCEMGCTHCMDDSSPEGKHMSWELFKVSVECIKRIDPMIVIVSGGEPLEHPKFFEMVEYLKLNVNDKTEIVVTSNGTFLENYRLYNKCIELDVSFHRVNDKRYYPRPINYSKEQARHKNISIYTEELDTIYPVGRAKENNISSEEEPSPTCFNLRSLVKNNLMTLSESLYVLMLSGRLCTPSIDIEGQLRAGESNTCGVIGDVSMTNQELEQNIRVMHCNNCKMFNKLPFIHKLTVGEE